MTKTKKITFADIETFADVEKEMKNKIIDNANESSFNSEELYDAYLNIIVPGLQNMQDD